MNIILDTLIVNIYDNLDIYKSLQELKNKLLISKKIIINSYNINISGPILDKFFTEVNELPNCIELFCNNNNITILPSLPICKGLDCSSNKLQYLPELPKCEKILCHDNNLKTLPKLHNCIQLSVTNNNLESIHSLPNCEWLECNGNKIKELPLLPKCKDLDCSNNNLKLITLNQVKECQYLTCENNPNIIYSKQFAYAFNMTEVN